MLRRNFKLKWFDILIHSENLRHHEHVKQILILIDSNAYSIIFIQINNYFILATLSSKFFKIFTRRQKEDSNFLFNISCEMSKLSRLFSRRTNFISLELNHNESNTKNTQDIIEKLFLIKYDLISNRLEWKTYLHLVFND
jgi:hypothetical protein